MSMDGTVTPGPGDKPDMGEREAAASLDVAAEASTPEPFNWKFRWAPGAFVVDPMGQRGIVDTAGVDRGGTVYLVRYPECRFGWWPEHQLIDAPPE